jgi:serine/threonine protein kinase
MVGRVLRDRYQVLDLLGVGGMGAVYEAVQLDLGRRVAVKVLSDVEPNAVARFHQEAIASAAMSHPHVVQVTDFVVAADGESPPFIVMEVLKGESLGILLKREGRLGIERAVRLAAQTLSGLAEAHRIGIVHRDVKPSNVFLVRMPHGTDHVKLLDFGIAKLLDGGGFRTSTGVRVGTPAYMAPEQVRAGAVDARTDIHAVGSILFEMIMGRRAFPQRGVPDIMTAVCNVNPPRLDELLPDVPRALADIVATALAKDPAHRFASADAMTAALSPWLTASGRPVVITHAHAHAHASPPVSAGPTALQQTAPLGRAGTLYERPSPAAFGTAPPPTTTTILPPAFPATWTALPPTLTTSSFSSGPPPAVAFSAPPPPRQRVRAASRAPVLVFALIATMVGAGIAILATLAILHDPARRATTAPASAAQPPTAATADAGSSPGARADAAASPGGAAPRRRPPR